MTQPTAQSRTTQQPGHLGYFFLAAFGLLAVVLGYYTLIARTALLARTDNPRALIAYNRIHRGTILDRNSQPLAETTGLPGGYVRRYEPSAALVVGYASFTYGLSGIEQFADSTLTGLNGLDDLTRWWRYDVLNEPVIGSDIQLTLDLELQRAAFNALNGYIGAAVIIDIPSGDILAMASSPSFDPARLETDFDLINADTRGPFINRATLGLYRADDILESFPASLDLSRAPVLPIATRPAEGSHITPLQLALVVAAITNNGATPAPRLLLNAPSSDHPITILARDRMQPTVTFNATIPSGFEDETLGWYASADGQRVVVIVLENATKLEAKLASESIKR